MFSSEFNLKSVHLQTQNSGLDFEIKKGSTGFDSKSN